MLRKPVLILALTGATWSCGDSVSAPSPPPSPRPAVFSVSPDNVPAGSADVTITVHGSGFRVAKETIPVRSYIVFSLNGRETQLYPVFIDTSTLTVVIPGNLLANPGDGVVSVWNGDPADNQPGSMLGAADFNVAVGAPLLTAVSPNQALALSAAITVRMSGSSFSQSKLHHSTALWRVGSDTTPLSTQFVSDTVLTAVIPPYLLLAPVHALLLLQTGDLMGEGPMTYSNSVGFEVKASSQ